MKYTIFIFIFILVLFVFYRVLSYGEMENKTNLEIRKEKKSEEEVNNLLRTDF